MSNIKKYLFLNFLNLYIFYKKNIKKKLNFHMDPHLFISKNLPKKPIIIEAGSADGNDTLKFAKKYPQGIIYSLEPMQSFFQETKRKTESYKNVKLFNLAFSVKNGSSNLNVSTIENEPWGSSSLLKPKLHIDLHPDIEFNSTEKVKTIKYDTFLDLNDITYVDLLWLDLQGIEPDILASSKNLRHIKYLYTEVSLLENYEGQMLYKDFKRLMNNNSFVVHFEDIRWKDGGNVMFKNKKFIHKRSSNLI
jgi:FkbM family methyltransferase